jgi:hypothetical protein
VVAWTNAPGKGWSPRMPKKMTPVTVTATTLPSWVMVATTPEAEPARRAGTCPSTMSASAPEMIPKAIPVSARLGASCQVCSPVPYLAMTASRLARVTAIATAPPAIAARPKRWPRGAAAAEPKMMPTAKGRNVTPVRSEDDERPGGPAELTAFDERVEKRDQGTDEHERPSRVEALGSVQTGRGDHAGSEGEGGDADRNVDKEDGPPAEPGRIRFDQGTAEQRPGCSGKSKDHAVKGECLGLGAGREFRLDERKDLGKHHRGGGSLGGAEPDERPGRLGGSHPHAGCAVSTAGRPHDGPVKQVHECSSDHHDEGRPGCLPGSQREWRVRRGAGHAGVFHIVQIIGNLINEQSISQATLEQ